MTIRIEVCERRMDSKLHPVIDSKTGAAKMERSPRYHAQIADKPGVWAAGDTRDEAIGDLIRCHPEEFGVEVVYLKGPQGR